MLLGFGRFQYYWLVIMLRDFGNLCLELGRNQGFRSLACSSGRLGPGSRFPGIRRLPARISQELVLYLFCSIFLYTQLSGNLAFWGRISNPNYYFSRLQTRSVFAFLPVWKTSMSRFWYFDLLFDTFGFQRSRSCRQFRSWGHFQHDQNSAPTRSFFRK